MLAIIYARNMHATEHIRIWDTSKKRVKPIDRQSELEAEPETAAKEGGEKKRESSFQLKTGRKTLIKRLTMAFCVLAHVQSQDRNDFTAFEFGRSYRCIVVVFSMSYRNRNRNDFHINAQICGH